MNTRFFLSITAASLLCLGGCSNSDAPPISKDDAKNFKGSTPPADVWQKIAESQAKYKAEHGGGGAPAGPDASGVQPKSPTGG